MEHNLIETYMRDTESFIRKSISEEELAISVYLDRKKVAEMYAEDCRNLGDEELAKKFDAISYTLQDILEEEEVHVGQFRELLDLIGISKNKENEGSREAQKDIKKLESFTDLANKLKIFVD